MKKNARNRVNNAADSIQKRIKKTQKIISILVVFILISTIASSVASSSTFKNNNLRDENDTPIISSIKKLLDGKSLRERLETLRENIKNKLNKLSNNENVEENEEPTYGNFQKTSLTSFIKDFIALKNADSSILLYTNYEGHETRNDLKLLRANKVDVNDDGVDDISAKLSLYPFIEKPLSL